MRRRLVALGSIVVVVVAVIIVLTSSQGDRRLRPGDRAHVPGPRRAAPRRRRRRSPNRARSPTRPRRPTGSPTRGPVPILEYHVLGKPPEGEPYPELFVGRDDFAKQMDWLEERGYEAVTLEQVQEAWYHGGTLPPKPIVLSFDDGYRPQFTFALPTLKQTRLGGRPQPQGRRLRPLRIERQGDDRGGLGAGRAHDPPPRPDRTRARRSRRRSRGLAEDPAEGITASRSTTSVTRRASSTNR